MNKGKLIVIDGLDGCGKSTQLELVKNILVKSGYKVKTISFPDYESSSSALVKMYLNGEFSSNPADINAYAASSFYAVDRYASYMKHWKKEYEDGYIILAARYVSSNALHQMSKVDFDDWNSFLKWLYDYEYEKLGVPKANAVIFLDMPIEISQSLLSSRYNGDESKKDIHESDIDYLKNCRKAALYASSELKWNVVNCADSDKPLPVDTISEKIMNIISKIL